MDITLAHESEAGYATLAVGETRSSIHRRKESGGEVCHDEGCKVSGPPHSLSVNTGSGATAEGVGAGEREAEAVGIGVEPGEAGVEGHRLGKCMVRSVFASAGSLLTHSGLRKCIRPLASRPLLATRP
jgi:hypothetical protein